MDLLRRSRVRGQGVREESSRPDNPTMEPHWISISAVGPIGKFSVFFGDSLPGLDRILPPEEPLEAEFMPISFGSFGDFLRLKGEKDGQLFWIEGVGALIPLGTVLKIQETTIGDLVIPPGYLTFKEEGLLWSAFPGP